MRRLKLRRVQPLQEEGALTAINFIKNQLEQSGQCLGYKAMHRRLQQEGIIIGRNKVRIILKHLDSDAVRDRQMRRLRRRRYANPGPNSVWHIDGYDKLKPYGFAIHGAIDGFSRRVLWLEVGVSNNNPKVVLKYFINTITQLQCVPRVVRSDHGTENVFVENLQVLLRSRSNDSFAGQKSFMKGKSSANQRIERWWGILRLQCVNFWMNLFKDMISIGALDTGNHLHILALRFCFMDLIERDIQRCAEEWNRHVISRSRRCDGPHGKPNMMYFNPQMFDSQSYGFPLHFDIIDPVSSELDKDENIQAQQDPDFVALMHKAVPDWTLPLDVQEGLGLYERILDFLDQVQ